MIGDGDGVAEGLTLALAEAAADGAKLGEAVADGDGDILGAWAEGLAVDGRLPPPAVQPDTSNPARSGAI
ncbi:MAG: hypothetical protein J7639_20550 [Paenibacillaceae bacterium]|nr:hypothetical protein [Paenibacillaceae bacterium]